MTLAGANGQALPTLDLVPISYRHEVHSELLFDLCASLVRLGLASPELWIASRESGNQFVVNAIRAAITDERIDLLERNLEYYLQIADVVERYGYDRALESTDLGLTICSGNCGYLEIGEAIEALEKAESGLGAAFYWELLHSLYGIMRVYDHNDALMHEEQLHEWVETEEEGAVAQYEFPEVEKSLPECIRKTLKEKKATLEGRRLLLKHRHGKFGAWIERLRRIQALSRLYPKAGKDLSDSYYDSDPLPSILIVFKQHDAVAACFDECSQHMLEGSPEPTLSVVFSPREDREVEKATKIVKRFILLNCELFQLVEEIHNWGEKHERRDVDRGELSLRAA